MDEKDKQAQAVNLNINFDSTPVLFTDNVIMTTNDNGFVLNVMQQLINTNQVRVVARIGMSREHAKKLAAEMGRLLAMTEGQGQTATVKKGN